MTDQNGYRREGNGAGSSCGAIVDVPYSETQIHADFRVHGVQSNLDTNEQCAEDGDRRTHSGKMPQNQNQGNRKSEQQPLAPVNRDLFRTVNQICQQLRDQEAEDVSNGENLPELGVAVPAVLKIDCGIAYDPTEADPVEALNKGIFQIYNTKLTMGIRH